MRRAHPVGVRQLLIPRAPPPSLPELAEVIRRGLRMRLEISGTYEVVVAPDGAEGVALAVRARPDLILMDLNLNGLRSRTMSALGEANVRPSRRKSGLGFGYLLTVPR